MKLTRVLARGTAKTLDISYHLYWDQPKSGHSPSVCKLPESHDDKIQIVESTTKFHISDPNEHPGKALFSITLYAYIRKYIRELWRSSPCIITYDDTVEEPQ